jgi:hypothetical protein
MNKAAHLTRRLAHATSKAVIVIINPDGMNCPVSATDVCNKGTAKGLSIAKLLAKTTKRATVSPGYAIAHRVTQVHKILSVDIILVKKVAYLLSVIISRGLGLVCLSLPSFVPK